MKRSVSVLFVVLPLLGAACSKPEVQVRAELPGAGGAASTPVADLPVRLLPYDRDAILDSLTRAAKRPEPQVPANLQPQRDSLVRLQAAWRAANARLKAIADTAATLTVQVRPGAAESAEREQKLKQAQRLGLEQQQVNQQVADIQRQIAALSGQIGARLDSVQTARRAWSETTFKDFDAIVQRRLKSIERNEVADTTGREGTATFHVEEGRWWVYARYALPDHELYWNFPVEVSGKQTTVRLTEQNAKKRPLY